MSLLRRLWSRLPLSTSQLGKRLYGEMFDPLDMATGIEKRELLAHLAGNCDPFHIMPFKRTGAGCSECPTLVPSAFQSRIMGCLCYEGTGHIEYMVLHQCQPKRCSCGYWFMLCEVEPL